MITDFSKLSDNSEAECPAPDTPETFNVEVFQDKFGTDVRMAGFLTELRRINSMKAEIQAVVVGGNYLDRNALDAMLAKVKQLALSKEALDVSKIELQLNTTLASESKLSYSYQQWPSGGEKSRKISTKDGTHEPDSIATRLDRRIKDRVAADVAAIVC